MSEVEFLKDGLLIRTSNQFEIECNIMTENSAKFTLAHSFPLLQSLLIDKVGFLSENETFYQIMSQGEVQL